jgi:RNA polymerase sigma factor (sigma-70 family)
MSPGVQLRHEARSWSDRAPFGDDAGAPAEPEFEAEPDAADSSHDDSAVEANSADEAANAARACAAALDDGQLAALVLRICDQHEPSLATLYEAASGRVYGLVLRIVRQASLAEEVVEDVFWQVWREAPRFDAKRGNVIAWLLAIARSRAIDALRRQERIRAAEVAVDDNETLQALSAASSDGGGDDDPLDLVAASRRDARLHQLLLALDPLPRQLLSLAFFRGCTHEEIAAQTGIALGTVKSHIRRTLVALRGQLAPNTPISQG